MDSTEVVGVQKNLTLEINIEEYNETEVRFRLAEVYGIAADRISLDLSAGSVQLLVTFLPSEAASNSSVADSLPALMQAVEVPLPWRSPLLLPSCKSSPHLDLTQLPHTFTRPSPIPS